MPIRDARCAQRPTHRQSQTPAHDSAPRGPEAMQCRRRALLATLACSPLSMLQGCGGGGGGGGGDPIPAPGVPAAPAAPVAAPVIASFAAAPASIGAGQATTLSWSVSGAASLSIGNGVGDVTGQASKSVSPTATTTYLLTATNAAGTASASATVVVAVEAALPPSAAALAAARDYNFSAGGQTHLVMHYGTVIDEAYANGGAADRVQLLASATKGFTGMIGAIAASEGLFGLDEPVAQRALVEWQTDAAKAAITFRHLLTMTSGLKELNGASGWLDYLAQPVDYPGGSTFIYSGDPNIFGLALERRLGGEQVVDYFERRLLQPLGITSLKWGTNFADGHPQLSGGAYVTARDWAKFGEFIRRTLDGTWSGPTLLSKTFFDQVLAGNPAHPAYGFYWWLKKPVPASLAATIDANNKSQFTRQIKPIIESPKVPGDFVMAAGAYGQRLYVIPSLGLTVIRHAPVSQTDNYDDIEFLERLLGG